MRWASHRDEGFAGAAMLWHAVDDDPTRLCRLPLWAKA